MTRTWRGLSLTWTQWPGSPWIGTRCWMTLLCKESSLEVQTVPSLRSVQPLRSVQAVGESARSSGWNLLDGLNGWNGLNDWNDYFFSLVSSAFANCAAHAVV